MKNDNTLKKIYKKADKRCFIYNICPNSKTLRRRILEKLLDLRGEHICIKPPFYCSIGKNITIGHDFFCNRNCIFLDDGKITIGDNVMIGPNVGIYTVNHPMDYMKRNRGEFITKDIVIEDNVWIAANCVILPGVKIGRGSVIGAGVVVDKNIPENSLVKRNDSIIICEIDSRK